MGFMEKFREWAKVEEDEDDFEEFVPDEKRRDSRHAAMTRL